MAHNARYARLAIEYTKLMNLAARSSFIQIQPVEVQRGWPPEKYIITYTCRGIASIDKTLAHKVSEFHQVSMYMGSDYPLKEPYLKWLTPIWHPNIDHLEPHHVCTNNVQNWFAAKPLAELVLAMGEMVQYKQYHAKWTSPFPLDRAAADWVIGVGEPKGIVGPDKPLDDRPLLNAQRMRNQHQPEAVSDQNGSLKQVKVARAQLVVSGAENRVPRVAGYDPLNDSQPLQAISQAIKFRARTGSSEDTRRLVPIESVIEAPPADIYSIEISKDGQFQRVAQISKAVVSVGRGGIATPVDVSLEGDLTMSRLHLIIERDDTGAFWMTVKGQNPVVMNGRVIPKERSIGVEAGAVIEICSYSLTLR